MAGGKVYISAPDHDGVIHEYIAGSRSRLTEDDLEQIQNAYRIPRSYHAQLPEADENYLAFT